MVSGVFFFLLTVGAGAITPMCTGIMGVPENEDENEVKPSC